MVIKLIIKIERYNVDLFWENTNEHVIFKIITILKIYTFNFFYWLCFSSSVMIDIKIHT